MLLFVFQIEMKQKIAQSKLLRSSGAPSMELKLLFRKQVCESVSFPAQTSDRVSCVGDSAEKTSKYVSCNHLRIAVLIRTTKLSSSKMKSKQRIREYGSECAEHFLAFISARLSRTVRNAHVHGPLSRAIVKKESCTHSHTLIHKVISSPLDP